MIKEYLDYEVFIVPENIDEIYRQRVQVNLDSSGVDKKYQVHL